MCALGFRTHWIHTKHTHTNNPIQIYLSAVNWYNSGPQDSFLFTSGRHTHTFTWSHSQVDRRAQLLRPSLSVLLTRILKHPPPHSHSHTHTQTHEHTINTSSHYWHTAPPPNPPHTHTRQTHTPQADCSDCLGYPVFSPFSRFLSLLVNTVGPLLLRDGFSPTLWSLTIQRHGNEAAILIFWGVDPVWVCSTGSVTILHLFENTSLKSNSWKMNLQYIFPQCFPSAKQNVKASNCALVMDSYVSLALASQSSCRFKSNLQRKMNCR